MSHTAKPGPGASNSDPRDPGGDLESDGGDSGAIAVVRPTRKTEAEKDRKRKPIPRYHVVLWDDDDHSFDYVIRMLKELFGHPETKGFQLAEKVDTEGRVIVLTTTKEHAELKRDQIHAYGKDDEIKNCAGSMTASIEEAE